MLAALFLRRQLQMSRREAHRHVGPTGFAWLRTKLGNVGSATRIRTGRRTVRMDGGSAEETGPPDASVTGSAWEPHPIGQTGSKQRLQIIWPNRDGAHQTGRIRQVLSIAMPHYEAMTAPTYLDIPRCPEPNRLRTLGRDLKTCAGSRSWENQRHHTPPHSCMDGSVNLDRTKIDEGLDYATYTFA